MNTNLKEFNKKVTILNKDVAQYEDEKGNLLMLPLGQLFCNVEYKEIKDEELKIFRFEKKIPKDAELNKIEITTQVDKFTVTKNNKDKGTLVDKKIEVYQVWFVRNGLNLTTSFTTKKEAIELAVSFNNKILKEIK
jgi:hypothetical protein|nr:MAG TPA_asm: hypothetical protein [Caudoviricetes sp.]